MLASVISPVMKRVILTPWFVLLFGYVILLAHASAETPGGLKNATIPHRQRHRVARRFAGTNQHSPARPVEGFDRPDEELFTQIFAGAWQTNIPGGTGLFNSVTGQWQIPNVQLPPNPGDPDKIWEASAFIGIDGNAGICDALLQAGTTTYAQLDANGNLQTWVDAFAEWYPENEVVLTGLAVNIGDTVQVNIQAPSLAQGTVEFINLSAGTQTTLTLTSPSPDVNLCGLITCWVVESSPLPDGSRAPFVQFSPYTFEDCVAGTTSDLTADLSDATEIVMFDPVTMQALAYPTVVDDNSVTVTYGPAP